MIWVVWMFNASSSTKPTEIKNDAKRRCVNCHVVLCYIRFFLKHWYAVWCSSIWGGYQTDPTSSFFDVFASKKNRNSFFLLNIQRISLRFEISNPTVDYWIFCVFDIKLKSNECCCKAKLNKCPIIIIKTIVFSNARYLPSHISIHQSHWMATSFSILASFIQTNFQ